MLRVFHQALSVLTQPLLSIDLKNIVSIRNQKLKAAAYDEHCQRNMYNNNNNNNPLQGI